MISHSPDRHTFQESMYIERCKEQGQEPDTDYLNLFKSIRQRAEEQMQDPAWQKDNLEYDLRSADWILQKVRTCDAYAQNLYAAMCNRDFQKNTVETILQNKTWSCSWRSAGGVVADMRESGDYMDWYCSGIAGGDEPDVYQQGVDLQRNQHVPEGTVTDEIREDLFRLGWIVVENTR